MPFRSLIKTLFQSHEYLRITHPFQIFTHTSQSETNPHSLVFLRDEKNKSVSPSLSLKAAGSVSVLASP